MTARAMWLAAMAAAVVVSVTGRATGQAPQGPPPPPAQPQAIEGHPQGAGAPPPPQPPAGGRGGGMGRFPAQQRPPGDPELIQRGRALFAGACAACHGADARGGQLGGPNLLRSELALNDRAGELMFPVIKHGRPGTTMPPSPLPDEDLRAIVAFIHDLQSRIGSQGSPPPGGEVELDILVGDAKAGEAYFAAKCAACHTVDDMKAAAARAPSPKAVQNMWVSGGRAMGRGAGGGRQSGPPRAVTTATITLPSGERVSGRLLRLDDFLVTIAQEDGTQLTFRRKDENEPKIDIEDPLTGHRELLRVLTNADMHNVTAYLVTLK